MKKNYLLLFLVTIVTISLAVPYKTSANNPPPSDSVITLYPNPTDAGVNVKAPKNTNLLGCTMEIFSPGAKTLTVALNYSADRTTYVDLSGIRSEIIFVRIFDKAKTVIYTGKVLKFTH